MKYKIYKWIFIMALIAFGVLQFFELSDVFNYIGLVIIIFFGTMYGLTKLRVRD